MEKTKLLTLAVIGLLLINFGTLGFLLIGTKGHRPPPHDSRLQPKEFIIEALDFDAAQQQEYAQLIQWHRGEIDKLDRNIRETKQQLYAQLSRPETDIKVKDSLIALINSYQKQVEATHFKHFEDIKKICHKDQMENFDKLTEELDRIFAPKPREPRHE